MYMYIVSHAVRVTVLGLCVCLSVCLSVCPLFHISHNYTFNKKYGLSVTWKVN